MSSRHTHRQLAKATVAAKLHCEHMLNSCTRIISAELDRFSWSLDVNKLHIKEQGRVAGDDIGDALRAVSHLGWNGQLPFVPNPHANHPLVPSAPHKTILFFTFERSALIKALNCAFRERGRGSLSSFEWLHDEGGQEHCSFCERIFNAFMQCPMNIGILTCQQAPCLH